jgi:hypothetical protein
LIGKTHPVVLYYGRFMRLYEKLKTRLESELYCAYGRHLVPVIMVFHVQLALRNWMVCQLGVADTDRVEAPDFCQGLHMLEVQNNLIWLPILSNVHVLLAL